MSFPRYPKYKASGVEWLREVPEGWTRIRYKNVFDEKQSVRGDSLPSGSISFGEVVFKSDKILHELTKASYQELLVGEFLINPINLNYDLKSLRTGLSDINTCVSPAYIILRAKVESNKNYLKYQLYLFDVSHMKTLGAGVRQTITFGDIGTCSTCLPPLFEQTAIAEFLDRETAKIDGLVAKQRRLMELLKEKRQAVISRAVTKGLNPSAPMKPSGIEWLGDVPAGWTVRKVSQLFRAGKGKNGQMLTKEFCGANEGEYPVYSGQTENEGVMGTWDQFEFDFGKAGVLFSTTVGAKAMHLRQLFGRFSLSQNCMIIWTISTLCITRFFYYHFQPLFQWQRSMIPDHMQPSFRMEDLYACAIALPPTDEQSAIVAFLDSELLKFDTLAAEAQRAIDLLQERRTALISAAVTGQIDVRQPPKN